MGNDTNTRLIISAQDNASPTMERLRKSLDDVKKSTESAGSAFGRMGSLAAGSVAGLSFAAVASELHKAGMEAERLKNAFQAAAGSIKGGADSMMFVRLEAARLGLNLQSTADGYMKLSAASKGTALEGQATQQIFKAVAGASSALGLSADQSNGALLALSQMMSKGVVQAEELRGQLGERLPGAFQIAARSMGVSTAELGKMLETGKVMADDFLPKFANELAKTFPPSEKAMSGLTAETNRLNTAFGELKTTIMAGGGESLFLNAITGMKDLVVEADTFYSRMHSAWKLLADFSKNPMDPNLGGNVKNRELRDLQGNLIKPSASMAPLNAFEKYMSAPDFSVVGPSGGASYLLGAADNIFSKPGNIPSPTKEMLAEFEKTMKSRKTGGEGYSREGDLLLKNIELYAEQMKAQEDWAAQLGQNLFSIAESENRVFGLMTGQTGELSTDRYNITPLSAYRLRTNDQYSLPMSPAGAPAVDLQGLLKSFEDLQEGLYRNSPWEGLTTGIRSYQEEVGNLGRQFENFSNNTMNSMSESLASFVTTGKMNFNDLANSIIGDLVRIQMRAMVSGVFSQLTSWAGSAFSDNSGINLNDTSSGGLLAGARADGGPVSRGSSYLVGERGPELFTPGASGMITPNHALGGAAGAPIQFVLNNNTGQQVKARDGGSSFDGKTIIKTVVLEAMDTDPSFRWALRGQG